MLIAVLLTMIFFCIPGCSELMMVFSVASIHVVQLESLFNFVAEFCLACCPSSVRVQNTYFSFMSESMRSSLTLDVGAVPCTQHIFRKQLQITCINMEFNTLGQHCTQLCYIVWPSTLERVFIQYTMFFSVAQSPPLHDMTLISPTIHIQIQYIFLGVGDASSARKTFRSLTLANPGYPATDMLIAMLHSFARTHSGISSLYVGCLRNSCFLCAFRTRMLSSFFTPTSTRTWSIN